MPLPEPVTSSPVRLDLRAVWPALLDGVAQPRAGVRVQAPRTLQPRLTGGGWRRSRSCAVFEEEMSFVKRSPNQEIISQFHHSAAEGDIARLTLILSHSPSLLNETSENGWTALMYAARNGHPDAVQFLLEKGCDRSITS